ncbi:MAG: hypothetical protein V1847_01395, partial [Candidatus Diapherotrites archaeon]
NDFLRRFHHTMPQKQETALLKLLEKPAPVEEKMAALRYLQTTAGENTLKNFRLAYCLAKEPEVKKAIEDSIAFLSSHTEY